MLKTLGGQVKEFKKDSILTPVFMILEVIMETIIPLIMGSIIDDGVQKGNLTHIYLMGALMVLTAFVSLWAGAMGGKYGASASTGFARNLRKAMYDNIQTFSFSNIDKFSTSGLVTRLTTDVTNVQNAYQMILRMCMRAPASLICAMAMSFYVNARVASIYLIAVIILGCFLALIIKVAMKYFDQVFKKYDKLNESVQENVNAIRVVKAYSRESFEQKKFTKASENVYKMFIKAEKTVAYNMPLMNLTVYSCILIISLVGAKLIVGGDMEIGNLSTLLAYCMNILMSLMMLSMVFVMITMSVSSAERICEVINEKPDITNPEKPVMEVKSGDISFEHVNFSYKKEAKTPVLKDINLEIKSGQTIGIIGGTGSAKSSLVNLLSRLYDVTDGAVKIGGIDVRRYDIETLRDEVAVVLQKNVLFSGTILDNLRWGDKNATEEECRRACQLACADDFIEKMPDKYNTFIEQGGSNVSGGQKQRLCIARALIGKAKILIFDDSTSAVDTATEKKIREALAARKNVTKIIIAQRVTSVMNTDQIIILDDGKVHRIGTHAELLADDPIYQEIYASQMKGGDENGSESL